jgi:SAM-dependent methyltransferase
MFDNPMPQESVPLVAEMVVYCCALLRGRLAPARWSSGLVVGCGAGDEVVYMRHHLQTDRVFGVDIDAGFSGSARTAACVLRGDAQRLPFLPSTFHFAAAFHSLEHVGDPQRALSEIRRVLRPGAWFYLGVPNSARLVGYLGSFDATTWQKITWNLKDWKGRVRREFRNECGAHAGFGREELVDLLEPRFACVQFLTEDFIRFKYASRLPGRVLDVLLSPGVVKYSASSHYVLCRKAITG